MFRSFFWGDHPNKKSVHIIEWKQTCNPIEGGLEIRDPKEKNLPLLAKSCWRCQSHENQISLKDTNFKTGNSWF